MQQWRIDTHDQTLVFSSLNERLPCVIYWGNRLPENENLVDLADAVAKDWGDNLLDKVSELSVLPEQSANFPGQLGSKMRSLDGRILSSDFIFSDHKVEENSLILIYSDESLEQTYTLTISAFEDSNTFTLNAKIDSKKPIFMDWLSAPVIQVPQNSNEMIDYSGQWGGEFQNQITPWVTGAHLRESRSGTTSHANFPSLLIPTIGSSENSGSCYGFHYGWSGGHRMIA